MAKFFFQPRTLLMVVAGFFLVIALAVVAEATDLSVLQGSQPLLLAQSSPHAQPAPRLRTGDAWQQLYQILPDFPRENQYISTETGDVAESNTLVSRMIRYHTFIKGRLAASRLDWKLTLADYLGANERMSDLTYPSGDTLRINPIEGDRMAIDRLDRRQRQAFVDAIVQVFTLQESGSSIANPATRPAVPPTAAPMPPEPMPTRIPDPQPGDAQLLLPQSP
jgi:hypothetical protein